MSIKGVFAIACQILGHNMKFSTVFVILCIFSLSFACKPSGEDEAPILANVEIPKKMLGAPIALTENDMNELYFKKALNTAIKKLNDSNTCHNFKLERVSAATKKVVGGLEYKIKFDVRPIFDGADKEECSQSHYLNSGDVQSVEVLAWLQPWKSDVPQTLAFTSTKTLGSNGMFLNP
ncbi:unnamed protein product [Rodentolepis nana]|uniref:Cystatin domain-containing protein n=1 Tax=Rodentolepis nana TaxID=102285 RepID=A0A0R3T3G3_RODNA|nr:unnamed protein product [Rodentolepis nana]